MIDYSKLSTELTEGEYTIEIKLRCTFQYQDLAPKENTVAHAIAHCRDHGELIDWSVDGD